MPAWFRSAESACASRRAHVAVADDLPPGWSLRPDTGVRANTCDNKDGRRGRARHGVAHRHRMAFSNPSRCNSRRARRGGTSARGLGPAVRASPASAGAGSSRPRAFRWARRRSCTSSSTNAVPASAPPVISGVRSLALPRQLLRQRCSGAIGLLGSNHAAARASALRRAVSRSTPARASNAAISLIVTGSEAGTARRLLSSQTLSRPALPAAEPIDHGGGVIQARK